DVCPCATSMARKKALVFLFMMRHNEAIGGGPPMLFRVRASLVTAAIVNVYLVAATLPHHAQVRTPGQVVGTVRDASGAVVPNSDLVLQDTGTGLVLNGRTDKDG